MTTKLGTFNSKRWGVVTVSRSTYQRADGPVAVMLTLNDGEPLATLSVNMYRPECSHDSSDLPADCFYAKDWSENEDLAREALASGLFVVRRDLPAAKSGFVTARAWQFAAAPWLVRPVDDVRDCGPGPHTRYIASWDVCTADGELDNSYDNEPDAQERADALNGAPVWP